MGSDFPSHVGRPAQRAAKNVTLSNRESNMSGAFQLVTKSDWTILWVALVLVGLLIVSFRSRAYVFCQYLKTMTGIALRPTEVRRAFKSGGREGVRSLFLDLIIREDLKQGPVAIPDESSVAIPDSASGNS